MRARPFGLGRVAIIAEVTDRGAADVTLQPASAKNLREFSNRLAELPRRRDYKTVPMIADKPDLWNKAALDLVMNHNGGLRQAWEHTDLNGGWLNGMRKTLNGQLYAVKLTNQTSCASPESMATPITPSMTSLREVPARMPAANNTFGAGRRLA
jgi:hypothetical protein